MLNQIKMLKLPTACPVNRRLGFRHSPRDDSGIEATVLRWNSRAECPSEVMEGKMEDNEYLIKVWIHNAQHSFHIISYKKKEWLKRGKWLWLSYYGVPLQFCFGVSCEGYPRLLSLKSLKLASFNIISFSKV